MSATTHRIIRTLATTIAGLLAATLIITACTTKQEPQPDQAAIKQAATAWLQAVDQGDAQKQCDLSTSGQTDRAKCLKYAQPKTDAYSTPPRADHLVPWGNGYAVAVEVHLRASSATRWNSVGVVPNGSSWLVSKIGWIEGDPKSDEAVTGALS